MLGYQYAWLLDSLGKKYQAAQILDGISKHTMSINLDISGNKKGINTLVNYAKIQQAIINSENFEYKNALEIIDFLKIDPNDTHILTLTDSIAKGLQVLIREVPQDVNDH